MVSFRGFKKWLRFRQLERDLRNIAVGINSTVDFAEDRHIVMLDYDTDDFKKVKRSVEELQRFWKLSDFFIFRTKHGYHALGFYDHIPYGRLRMIIEFARDVDLLYKYISRYHNHRTLRVIGKHKLRDIEFVTLLQGVRTPTKQEFEIGELKRKEHMVMIGVNY